MEKPFHFRLKKVSSKQQQLLDAVMSFLPRTGIREGFNRGVREAVEKHAGGDVGYQLEAVSEMTHQSFMGQLPSIPVLVILSCVPVDKKAYLLIDNVIAHLIIEKLLGGVVEGDLPSQRKLTDTEQGVLQYLLLQVLSHVHRLCGKSARVQFRFDRFIEDQREAEELMRSDEHMTVLTLRLTVGEHAGFVKLALPDALVESAFLNLAAEGERAEEEVAHDLNELAKFGNYRMRMWLEAGRTTLVPAELMELEPDDVVLFDETDLILNEKGVPGGRAVLRVGMGEHGGFMASITADSKSVHARLEQQIKGETI